MSLSPPLLVFDVFHFITATKTIVARRLRLFFIELLPQVRFYTITWWRKRNQVRKRRVFLRVDGDCLRICIYQDNSLLDYITVPCSLEVDRHFRGTYCLHRQIALMMEALRTSETVTYFETTRRYIPEGYYFDNRHFTCVVILREY
jgi:hypothetical protein